MRIGVNDYGFGDIVVLQLTINPDRAYEHY
jgi:hypothetical protein